MRVCVTGATGFLGGAVVRRFLREGTAVCALARPSARADELVASGAEVVRGDLGDPAAIARAVAGANVVYHVAAMVEAPGDLGDFLDANRGGTERVFHAALQNGVRHIVYTSSIAVYGLVREGQAIDENTPHDQHPELRDAYSQSKIQADAFAVSFARQIAEQQIPGQNPDAARNRCSITILRPGVIYGPGKRLPFGLLGFAAGRINVIFANHNNRIPLNYIENLVDAMLLAGNSDHQSLRQYLVLDDDDLTLAQYHAARREVEGTRALFFSGAPVAAAARFAEAVGLVKPGAGDFSLRQVQRALQNRSYSTLRIRAELGWSPRVPLRDALRASLNPAKGA
jgi:nucleoside-diphosphate-sugar epimerase